MRVFDGRTAASAGTAGAKGPAGAGPAATNPLDLPIRNGFVKRAVERATGLGVLKGWYQDWLDRAPPMRNGAAFLDYTLGRLGCELRLEHDDRLDQVPRAGPVLFVANHPLGGLDGMLLARRLLAVRPDLKVLANEVLMIFPEFADLFIGVDVLSDDNRRANTRGIRELTRHMAGGGAVLIFPGKTVSRLRPPKLAIADPAWTETTGRLARRFGAVCVPIHVRDRNALSFYLAGLVHRRLRTALLVRAMLAKAGQSIRGVVGAPIGADEMARFADARSATDFLRMSCDVLAGAADEGGASPVVSAIRADVPEPELRREMARLAEYELVADGPLKVFCAPHARLGRVMDQIAIARERTFRAVDEGTGKECDSDRFDPYYWHLWAWDDAAGKVAGAYRLGRTDEIIRMHGLKNLYSRSLYHYDLDFMRQMGRAIEVGRSFVAISYQRHPKVLDLLWKGIAEFLARNPGYHTLFGCVSISSRFSTIARAFLADTFLRHYGADVNLCRRVAPTEPLRLGDRPWSDELIAAASEIPIINKLLGRIDNGKKVPVLIRQYLALNGRFISFSVNRGFNNSLDGLIVVDLRNAPARYLKRYFGAERVDHILSNMGKGREAA
ncbi:MAG: hemolysin [Alphaproteobacteria bacterium]|nr:MAG: hemolysin [Alphaproteobacteria bacterium]